MKIDASHISAVADRFAKSVSNAAKKISHAFASCSPFRSSDVTQSRFTQIFHRKTVPKTTKTDTQKIQEANARAGIRELQWFMDWRYLPNSLYAGKSHIERLQDAAKTYDPHDMSLCIKTGGFEKPNYKQDSIRTLTTALFAASRYESPMTKEEAAAPLTEEEEERLAQYKDTLGDTLKDPGQIKDLIRLASRALMHVPILEMTPENAKEGERVMFPVSQLANPDLWRNITSDDLRARDTDGKDFPARLTDALLEVVRIYQWVEVLDGIRESKSDIAGESNVRLSWVLPHTTPPETVLATILEVDPNKYETDFGREVRLALEKSYRQSP